MTGGANERMSNACAVSFKVSFFLITAAFKRVQADHVGLNRYEIKNKDSGELFKQRASGQISPLRQPSLNLYFVMFYPYPVETLF